MITETDVKDFQKLYKKHFKRGIGDDDARSKLLLLVKQAELLFSDKSQIKNEDGYEDEQEQPGLYS